MHRKSVLLWGPGRGKPLLNCWVMLVPLCPVHAWQPWHLASHEGPPGEYSPQWVFWPLRINPNSIFTSLSYQVLSSICLSNPCISPSFRVSHCFLPASRSTLAVSLPLSLGSLPRYEIPSPKWELPSQYILAHPFLCLGPLIKYPHSSGPRLLPWLWFICVS